MLHLPMTQLVGLDVYRDGGSLSALFRTDEPQRTYNLLFPIDVSPISPGQNPDSNYYSYKPPVVETVVTTYYKSPVTGVSSPIQRTETKPSSWEEARIYLQHIGRFLPGVPSDDVWVYDKMLIAAHNEGVVADARRGVERG